MRKLILIILVSIVSLTNAQWVLYETGYNGNIEEIAFFNSNRGVAVLGPNLLTTTNGGLNWTGELRLGNHLKSVFILNQSFGWILYNNYYNRWGIIYTSDSGQNWISGFQMNSYDQFMISQFFINQKKGWVIGTRGSIYFTDTGGSGYWYSQSSGTQATLNSVYFIDSLNGWAVGNYSNYGTNLIRTTNGGNTWISLIQICVHNLNSVFFKNKYEGWIVGDNAMVFRTTDEGNIWEFVDCGIDSADSIRFNDIHFTDQNYGWIIGNYGIILKTTNGGLTWNLQQSPTSSEFNSIYMLNSQIGWISTSDGKVLKTTNGGVTNIEREQLSVKNFNLYQNYPNPFNPSTTISWQLPVGSWQTIKVFDVLGSEIETLVDGYYEAGHHSTLFIVNSSLPSGIYFYQLKAGDYIQTRKMLLLK